MNRIQTNVIAFFKISLCINSCVRPAHLAVCDKLITLYTGQHTWDSKGILLLQNRLQLKRIEINHIAAQRDGFMLRYGNRSRFK